jgi:hypothetical protein
MRLKFITYCLLCLVLASGNCFAQVEKGYENIIQINGVIMTADSLRAVPYATVEVRNKNRGVESEYNGVFSIVCYKGDTLQFSCLGYKGKQFVVSKDLKGQFFSVIQLLVQDTFYLPETIIRPLPTKEGFDYAFTHWHIPNDQYEMARKNTDAYMLRALAQTLPKDGREAQSALLSKQAREAVYYGQNKPMNILNPIAWAEFFDAWKRGDFRRGKTSYGDGSSTGY